LTFNIATKFALRRAPRARFGIRVKLVKSEDGARLLVLRLRNQILHFPVASLPLYRAALGDWSHFRLYSVLYSRIL